MPIFLKLLSALGLLAFGAAVLSLALGLQLKVNGQPVRVDAGGIAMVAATVLIGFASVLMLRRVRLGASLYVNRAVDGYFGQQ